MHKSKLIRVLRDFSKEEWKELEKFTASPYLNNGRNYIPLVREIKKFYPSFNSGRLTKEYIYSRLFPSKEYKDTVMKTMLTGLYRLVEKFLMMNYLDSSKYEKERLLSHAYAVKGNFEGLKEALQSLDDITNTKKIDYDYFNYKQTIESGKVLYYQEKTDNYVKHQEHSINRGNYMIMDLILKLPQILNDSYFGHAIYNENRSRDISFAFAKNINFNKFISDIEASQFRYRDICRLFVYTAMLFTDPGNTANYFKAKKLYEGSFDDLSFQNQYILGLLLSNYCSEKKSPSSEVFTNEVFEIYHYMLKKNVFFGVYGSFIPHRPFIEYVNSACECGKLEEAESFINKYSVKLHEKHRRQVSNRCLTQLYIFRNDFHGALELIKDFNSDDINEIKDLKRLHAMIYYELSLYDNLEYTIDSAIKLMRTNKYISENKRIGIMLFLKHIKKLAEIRQNNDIQEAQVLLNKINEGEYFHLHYWFIKKLQDIVKQ